MMIPFATIDTAPHLAPKPTIVLVHGAWANASCWNGVIASLQKDGYPVAAVSDAMSSYADDVARTKRVLEGIKGPVVLVGHSYGGAVITGAATENVKALVYINAFAPDEGETLAGVQKPFPATPLGAALVPDSAGYLSIDRSKFHAAFCADLPEAEARLMAITQGSVNSELFGTPFPAPAWKTIPSWYLVGRQDQAINPDLERFFAKRMNAKTVEIDASHVSFLSHTPVVVKMIEEAAASTSKP